MSEIKRKMNTLLQIRAALDGGETNLFVKASIFDSNGVPWGPGVVPLPHLASGIYGENTLLMPNLEQIFVRTEVFMDALFTIPSPKYRILGLDIYMLDTLDPAQLVPKAYAVNASFAQNDVEIKIADKPIVQAKALAQNIQVVIEDNSVKTNIETQNQIEGVIND